MGSGPPYYPRTIGIAAIIPDTVGNVARSYSRSNDSSGAAAALLLLQLYLSKSLQHLMKFRMRKGAQHAMHLAGDGGLLLVDAPTAKGLIKSAERQSEKTVLARCCLFQ
jgi:hypothetical protein